MRATFILITLILASALDRIAQALSPALGPYKMPEEAAQAIATALIIAFALDIAELYKGGRK